MDGLLWAALWVTGTAFVWYLGRAAYKPAPRPPASERWYVLEDVYDVAFRLKQRGIPYTLKGEIISVEAQYAEQAREVLRG